MLQTLEENKSIKLQMLTVASGDRSHLLRSESERCKVSEFHG